QEPADELERVECHGPLPTTVGVVLPAEADLAVREVDQTVVADGRLVRVTGQVLQHRLGSGERPLDVRDPFGPHRLGEEGVDRIRPVQWGQFAGEAEPPASEGGAEPGQELAPKHAAEDADGEEEVMAAGDPAALVK